jgi:hypothetical protein
VRTLQRWINDGAQRSDPKLGDPAEWPYGHGPQGDAIRIYNYVRCVRSANARGDLNCDGLINGYDIDPFVLALSSAPDFAAYQAAYPDCDGMLADVNTDGAVNGFDIDPFVTRLTSGSRSCLPHS